VDANTNFILDHVFFGSGGELTAVDGFDPTDIPHSPAGSAVSLNNSGVMAFLDLGGRYVVSDNGAAPVEFGQFPGLDFGAPNAALNDRGVLVVNTLFPDILLADAPFSFVGYARSGEPDGGERGGLNSSGPLTPQ
jgi:hypothetical protein